MFSFLGDLASSVVARHPRVRLVAEAIEDAAADVAEEFGPRVVVAAMAGVDVAFDVLDAIPDGIAAVVDLPRRAEERAAALAAMPLRIVAIEAQLALLQVRDVAAGLSSELPVLLMQLRNDIDARRDDTRFVDLDRRLSTLEAAGDLEAR